MITINSKSKMLQKEQVTAVSLSFTFNSKLFLKRLTRVKGIYVKFYLVEHKTHRM